MFALLLASFKQSKNPFQLFLEWPTPALPFVNGLVASDESAESLASKRWRARQDSLSFLIHT